MAVLLCSFVKSVPVFAMDRYQISNSLFYILLIVADHPFVEQHEKLVPKSQWKDCLLPLSPSLQ